MPRTTVLTSSTRKAFETVSSIHWHALVKVLRCWFCALVSVCLNSCSNWYLNCGDSNIHMHLCLPDLTCVGKPRDRCSLLVLDSSSSFMRSACASLCACHCALFLMYWTDVTSAAVIGCLLELSWLSPLIRFCGVCVFFCIVSASTLSLGDPTKYALIYLRPCAQCLSAVW